MKKITVSSGKRKTSIARASISPGAGVIRVNNQLLRTYSSEAARLKILQSLNVATPFIDLDGINIKVNVSGGGVMGQADAIASAIARGLVEYSSGDDLLGAYHDYDRTLIAGDYRQTEVHKPSQSSKGPRHKRQKSYR